MADDRSLVSRIQGGDKQAFRELIRQNERLVAHMVGRLIDRTEDREDICQDVFIKVYEKLGEFNFQSKLSTWIATIAYRHALNYLRKRKIAFYEIPEDGGYFLASEETVEETLADEEMEKHVLSLVEKLPIQYKTVLTLYHLEDKSYTEIGEITGMPEGTVKNYLFRARSILKEKVKKNLGHERV